MSLGQLVDTSYKTVATASPFLGPEVKIATAALDTRNQQAARKGLNYVQAIVFGVAMLIAYIISISLLVSAGQSDTPHIQDGRWYAGWSILLLAALPLTWLTGYTIYSNLSCQGDVVQGFATFQQLR